MASCRLDVHWLASCKSWKTSTDIGSEAHRCIGSLGSVRGYLGLEHPPHGAMFSCLLHSNSTILWLPLCTSFLLVYFPFAFTFFASHTVSRSGTTDRYPIIRCSCPVRLFCRCSGSSFASLPPSPTQSAYSPPSHIYIYIQYPARNLIPLFPSLITSFLSSISWPGYSDH